MAEKSHKEAYLEALKYAKTGPDRTKSDQWRMENVKKSYSTIVDVPEYSKIIEAENVQRNEYENFLDFEIKHFSCERDLQVQDGLQNGPKLLCQRKVT